MLSECQFGRDVSERISSGLRGKSRRTRQTSVHFDNEELQGGDSRKIKDQTTNLMGEGIECVLDVALTNHTEMTDNLYSSDEIKDQD